MNNTIVYRPYRSSAWFVPFTIGAAIFSFVIVGYCIPYKGFVVPFLIATGITSLWLTKVLHDSSRITIFFEQEGFRIACCKHNDYRYVLWDEVSYAYYVRSFKGHLFLVLSPKALGPKEARSLANRAANSFRICIDYVVVIHIDVLQNMSQLKELIDNHVLHVDAY